MDRLEEIVRAAYDTMIGLDLTDLVVDGCITKAPCGGEIAGPSPVDRAKQGTKRSNVVDGNGIPLGTVTAPANQHDSPVLDPTLDKVGRLRLPEDVTVNLDRGYDSHVTRKELRDRELGAAIAKRRGLPAIRASIRRVVERLNSWQNAFKKLVLCTERRQRALDFYVTFANVVIILTLHGGSSPVACGGLKPIAVRRLIREGWKRYRWESRPARCP
jgi:hypothetical protein